MSFTPRLTYYGWRYFACRCNDCRTTSVVVKYNAWNVICQYFFYWPRSFFECSRGKTDQAAGEPVFCVNNPAVFLRKILRLFSMAKRQNFSMQPGPFSHSAFKKTLTVIKIIHEISMHYIFHSLPRKWRFIPYMSTANCWKDGEFENFMHAREL